MKSCITGGHILHVDLSCSSTTYNMGGHVLFEHMK